MRHISGWVVLVTAWALLGAAVEQTDDAGPSYRIEAIDGRLSRRDPPPVERLSAGNQLEAGSVVRTGWWSSARLSVPTADTTFELGARTTVRLASNRPGLLLMVEKGRVRGAFGPRSNGERLVETPSALLAVRGTEYGVAVDGSGATRVVVFEGEVDVADAAGAYPPVRVRAGEHTRIVQGRSPTAPGPHGMGPGDWDRGRMPHGMDGSRRRGPGRGHEGHPGLDHGGSGRHGG